MNRIALRMLLGDRSKYLMLLSGVLFATLLVTQGMALFAGIMSWTASTIRNVRAEVWVMDPRVEQVGDTKPMRDTAADLVRSVDGIAWSAKLSVSLAEAKLPVGDSKLVTLVGLDPTTFAGAPTRIVEGNLEDLRLPDAVLLDTYGVQHLGQALGRPLRVGDTLELNDHRAVIVGICVAQRSFTGGPYLFTTYDRALAFVPARRNALSFVLASPAPGVPAREAARRVREATGLNAQAEADFVRSTILWYVRNTGIPINVGTIVLIGLIVGTVVSGQTFYAFVLENLRNFGALKAMGLSNARLLGMLALQASLVGGIGYGLGLGVVSLLGRLLVALEKVPFLLLWPIPILTFVAIVGICVVSAALGMAKVARLEPATVFRS